MKEIYIDIMERAVYAYGRQRIEEYVSDVKRCGLKEHGFPRITANLAILNALGRCTEYRDIFLECMDICCRQIPHTKRCANEFSVREIVCAINLLKEHGTVSEQKICEWTELLSEFDPYENYDVVPKPGESRGNWAAFGDASEIMRSKLCGIDSREFIDNQLLSLLGDFDENGMYRDPNNPTVYDYVTRVLMNFMMYAGYDGKHKDIIQGFLDKSHALSAKLQSVTGDIAFGGRSNQFLHNQMWTAADYEYTASEYAKAGDMEKAGEFKAAAGLSAQNILPLLRKDDIHHIKNYYPVDSMTGCEDYGYFNKYMITLASMAYFAYLFADDSIVPTVPPCRKNAYIAKTSDDFHKVIANGFGYTLEFDTNADTHYDANGLGKINKINCPETICISVPFPSAESKYKTEFANPRPMSLCVYTENGGKTLYGADAAFSFSYLGQKTGKDFICAEFESAFPNQSIIQTYRISENGIDISQNGGENTGFCLPVLECDGRNLTEITESANKLKVKYQHHVCEYTFCAKAKNFTLYSNRNGRYRVYKVPAKDVHIDIYSE